MTQRDVMGMWVGGVLRMGNTCTPVADSCQCMAKPLPYCKVTSLQLCTGTTQRDGMGREEGGGFRMGNTCIPVADSF